MAARMPRYQSTDPRVTAMILTDSAMMISTLKSIALEQPFEIQQFLENRVLEIWYQNRGFREANLDIPEITTANERFVSSVHEFRNALNVNKEFVIFKVLVGFQSVFHHMWEDKNIDIENDKKIRNKDQIELVGHINQSTWRVWKRRLTKAMSVKSNDMATFPPLIDFLEQLATQQPYLLLDLLRDRTAVPNWIVPYIASILVNAGATNDVETTFMGWIRKGEYVTEIATAIISMGSDDEKLVKKVTEKAIQQNDIRACIALIEAAVRNFTKNELLWCEYVFFPCLEVLSCSNNYDWINRTWFSVQENSLFSSLSEEQSIKLLDSIVSLDSIDYRVERILNVVAERFRTGVLEWFSKRMQLSNDKTSSEYSPIPFKLNELKETLKPYASDIVTELRSWYDNPDIQNFWRASQLISKIYPDFDPPLPEVLEEMVRTGDNDTLNFLTKILEGFSGQESFVYFLKEFLRSPFATSEIENAVESLVFETGVVSGFYGRAQTYQNKIELLTSWLEDEERISQFATKQIRTLEKHVALETRRTQQEIALRRLKFGEDISDEFEGPGSSVN